MGPAAISTQDATAWSSGRNGLEHGKPHYHERIDAKSRSLVILRDSKVFGINNIVFLQSFKALRPAYVAVLRNQAYDFFDFGMAGHTYKTTLAQVFCAWKSENRSIDSMLLPLF